MKFKQSAVRSREMVAKTVGQEPQRIRQDNQAAMDAKLAAIAEAVSHEYPTADIDDMLRAIAGWHDPGRI